MVIYCHVDLEELRQQGKGCQWQKPQRCPSCEMAGLWGHGYVQRYFDGYSEPLWIKRYRCPHCRAVHTLRPATHYRRFQAPALVIFLSLLVHLFSGRWEKHLSRQRQQYWYKGFKKQALRLGMLNSGLAFTLAELFTRGIIFCTHSFHYCETKPVTDGAYPFFAVTPPYHLL